MTEWFKVLVLKTSVGQLTASSNLALSAKKAHPLDRVFFLGFVVYLPVILGIMSSIKTWYARACRLYLLNSPILYGLVFILFFLKSLFSLDPDFGWHLTSGQYILEHGIPRHDIYSYTMPEFPWIHHEWLADVGNYLVYHYLGGYFTLSIVYAGMWTMAVWLLARSTKHRLLVLLAVTLLLPFAGIRAITWTALLSAVLIILCQSKRPRVIYFVPAIMLLWANVHGSFVVGLLYLLWRLVAERNKANALVLLGSILVTLVTPYGTGVYIEVLRTISDGSLHVNIAEWMPLQPSVGVGICAGIWAAVLILTAKTAPWKRFLRFEAVLLVMSFTSARHTVLFLLFALPTILSGADALRMPIKTAAARRIAIGLTILLACTCMLFTIKTFKGYSLDREATYPKAITATLLAEPCSGNVFAHYNYGGYLIWKVPGEKLFIDGRMPSWSFKGQNIMADYLKITKDSAYRAETFSHYHVRCVVWNRSDSFGKTLQREGWSVERSEKNGTVLLRR